MANIYLELIQLAKQLPKNLTEMGSRSSIFDEAGGPVVVNGWRLCQFGGGVSPSGYTNEFHVLVDDQGDLWWLRRSQSPEDEGTTLWAHRTLRRIDAAQLHEWDINGWNFAIIRDSIRNLS